MNHDFTPRIDHETALRRRVPNADTLAVWQLLTTDLVVWTRAALEGQPAGGTIAEHLYNARAENYPLIRDIDLDCIQWNSLYEALRRWEARKGWKVTGNYR